MQDLTMYGEQELTLQFLKDTGLYDLACSIESPSELKDLADEFFIYTDDQLAELERDYIDGSFGD